MRLLSNQGNGSFGLCVVCNTVTEGVILMVFLTSVKARPSLAEHRASGSAARQKEVLPIFGGDLSLMLIKGNRCLLSHEVYIARISRSFRPTLFSR